jgi:endonuclease/exonuclease/phosphatase family metal-dependent hydrolase
VSLIVGRLDPPRQDLREAIKAGPVTTEAFENAFAALPALHQLEQVSPPDPPVQPSQSARIVFWNAERLKYLDASVAVLRSTKADAFLLCELDLGMARSGNRHTIAEAARALDAGYVYAVEFVELDLGDARERTWHAGELNAAGLHGAGLVSVHPLRRPELVRLETSGRWFDGAFGERRVGGRIAVMAELIVGGAAVLLISVHYESHTGPDDRLAQTITLLDTVDRRAQGMPVLIGGDFNTSTFDVPLSRIPGQVEATLRDDPMRLTLPVPYEPMFDAFRSRGYEWETCNDMGKTTQRTRPDGSPPPPFGRIDWIFARGLDCTGAAVIPAIDAKGIAISDHDLLAVTIQLAGE